MPVALFDDDVVGAFVADDVVHAFVADDVVGEVAANDVVDKVAADDVVDEVVDDDVVDEVVDDDVIDEVVDDDPIGLAVGSVDLVLYGLRIRKDRTNCSLIDSKVRLSKLSAKYCKKGLCKQEAQFELKRNTVQKRF